MTYGWALLIILVAISALVYFGILNADRFLPDRCALPTGLSCLSSKATATSAVFVIQNNLGQDISVTKIDLLTPSGSSICSADYSGGAGELINGDKNTFTLTSCSTGTVGKKFKGTIQVSYTDEENVPRIRSGELITKIEPDS